MEYNDGVHLKQEFLEAKRQYIEYLTSSREMREYDSQLNDLTVPELFDEAQKVYYGLESGKLSGEEVEKEALKLDWLLFKINDLALVEGKTLFEDKSKTH